MTDPKTPAQRKAEERARNRDAGLVRLELWAHPDDHATLKAEAERLRNRRERGGRRPAKPDPDL